ncbi:MAG: NAD+ synthase, partial [Deltaproteobacteria bacterium]|nr:NAD+ synthase [Deltaproteobacteria bacterium]
MKIAICQINTTVADFAGNVAKVRAAVKEAKKQKVDLAVFPELTTFGYPPRDLLDKPYLIQKNLTAAHQIAKESDKNFGIVFGFVSQNKSKGKGLYNSVCLAVDGKIKTVQPKSLLPTYDVFDEARHFDSAADTEPVVFKGVSLGLTVCEDIWSSYDFGGHNPYTKDPVAVLKKKGAEVIINISASPFQIGKQAVRRHLLQSTALRDGLPILFCNLVVGNDELVFDGRSLYVNANGTILFEGKRFEEELAIIDLKHKKPVADLAQWTKVEEIHDALIIGLRDYFRKCHFDRALLGLSGGIDSAVVAALAVEALGPQNVLGVAMPSPYSSASSVNDAKELAQNLGIKFRLIPINAVYASYLGTLGIETEKEIPLAAENIQARIRGNILMSISNQWGALVLSTGNKSELACGYCTLYGDLAGGLAILSDIPKTDVYALAKWINRKHKTIPLSILRKPPSAELKPNQRDLDSLPPYPLLDDILRLYVEEHKSVAEILKKGFTKKVVESVIQKIDRNEYKRRQAPPGIRVTSKAFGIGR